jgi:hypothetical protein
MRFNSFGTCSHDKTADCGWIFAQHFCNRLGASYLALKNVLTETNPAHEEVLMDIKRRFRDETFTRESIANVIHAHPELVRKRIHYTHSFWCADLQGQIRMLYVNFAMVQYPIDEAQRLMYAPRRNSFGLIQSTDLLTLGPRFPTSAFKPNDRFLTRSCTIVSGAQYSTNRTFKFSRASSSLTSKRSPPHVTVCVSDVM